mgnify:FL=1
MMNIKKVKPMFNAIITTMNRYEDDDSSDTLIKNTSGSLKEYQTVVAIGGSVRDIKVGDVVQIDPSRYAQKQHREDSLKNGIVSDNPVMSYNFKTILIDGEQCLLLYDSDISYIIEEYEEVEESSTADKELELDFPTTKLN